jgi:hypothetical protein
VWTDCPDPTEGLSLPQPFTARAESIQFPKERGTDDQRLFAVEFDNQAHNRSYWLVAAELADAGWTAHGVAGGCDGPAGRRPRSTTRSRPGLNFCGQWGANRFHGGGTLHAGEAAIREVRLTLADGTQLTDDADADVALFVGDRGERPATVEIFDVRGSLLSSAGPDGEFCSASKGSSFN